MKKLLGALTLATFLCVSGAAYAQDAATAKQDAPAAAAKQDAPKEDTANKKKETKKKGLGQIFRRKKKTEEGES